MGNSCSSSSKKNQKENTNEVDATNFSNKNRTNVEIDVVPDDQIPKDLIERTLKKVDTTDVDDIMDLNSPLTQVKKAIYSNNKYNFNVLERNGEKKERKKGEKSGES